MSKKPPIAERDFLKEVQNHNELCRKLGRLGLDSAEKDINAFAHHVGLKWFRLGCIHLREAKSSLHLKANRMGYSRAYYAAYNVSKSVRYIANGTVSLKGDDHGKAPELPGDFPDAAKWGQVITKLYEERLRADYDNWEGYKEKFKMTSKQAVGQAEEFILVGQRYLKDKYGLKP